MWKETFSKPGGWIGACGLLPPKAYLATRILIFLVWLACCIWSVVHWVVVSDDGFGYWLTKLTHWGAILELIYFASGAFTTYKAIYGKDSDGTGAKTPCFASFTWFMSSLVPVISIMVFLLYWILVFEPGPGKPEAISVVMHGGNFALVMLDLLLTRQPFYIQHVYAPLLMATVYCLFTLVYYLAGGTSEDGVSRYIYKSVDWSNPGGTIQLLGLLVIVGVPIVHLLLFCVVAARIRCKKAVEEQRQVDTEAPPQSSALAVSTESPAEQVG
eukprot:CAMPEP_0183408966 /NCGR_PEP_ID=MMETSP0370-20130417/18462_1 /TAXON_ID=268820 /ORGANISM="Peridinium aciculiferum, Strain PAER-2" /LENGTH=270 /DNA_ID=CAMNT_0025591565 /DNA_START=32 /DNA_END=844 /DNA_ORIENTATION=+